MKPKARRIICMHEAGFYPEGWTLSRRLDSGPPFAAHPQAVKPGVCRVSLVELRPMTLRERLDVIAMRRRYPELC